MDLARNDRSLTAAEGAAVFIVPPRPDPVPLHLVPLDDLMACPSASEEHDAMVAAAASDIETAMRDCGTPRNRFEAMMLRFAASDLRHAALPCAVDGFHIACCPDPTSGRPFAVVYETKTGRIAGGYDHKDVLVLPRFRKLGLGAEILIAAFETGVVHPSTMNVDSSLTTAGRANRRAAHRTAVERALDVGLQVPEEVLAAYPGLGCTAPSF